eukprot:4280418-Amphidinium_carterae.1
MSTEYARGKSLQRNGTRGPIGASTQQVQQTAPHATPCTVVHSIAGTDLQRRALGSKSLELRA